MDGTRGTHYETAVGLKLIVAGSKFVGEDFSWMLLQGA